jgi:hypothetical protein
VLGSEMADRLSSPAKPLQNGIFWGYARCRRSDSTAVGGAGERGGAERRRLVVAGRCCVPPRQRPASAGGKQARGVVVALAADNAFAAVSLVHIAITDVLPVHHLISGGSGTGRRLPHYGLWERPRWRFLGLSGNGSLSVPACGPRRVVHGRKGAGGSDRLASRC